MLAAIVSVLRPGCAWRHLSPGFGVATATAHRRLRRVDPGRAVLAPLRTRAEVAWSRALVDATAVRANRGDRGPVRTRPTCSKAGSTLPVLTDAAGLPRAVAVSAAHTPDRTGRPPLVRAIPAVQPRRGPRRRPDTLPADTGYAYPHLRTWLRARRLTPRIARRGGKTPTRLGRHRWRVESTIAHLVGYRRLTTGYECHPELCCAFPTLAAAPTCYHRLAT